MQAFQCLHALSASLGSSTLPLDPMLSAALSRHAALASPATPAGRRKSIGGRVDTASRQTSPYLRNNGRLELPSMLSETSGPASFDTGLQLDDDVDFSLPAAAASASQPGGGGMVAGARGGARVQPGAVASGASMQGQAAAGGRAGGAGGGVAAGGVAAGGVELDPIVAAWAAAAGRSTRDEWSDWVRRLGLEMIRASPAQALRACVLPAQSYPPLAQVLPATPPQGILPFLAHGPLGAFRRSSSTRSNRRTPTSLSQTPR